MIIRSRCKLRTSMGGVWSLQSSWRELLTNLRNQTLSLFQSTQHTLRLSGSLLPRIISRSLLSKFKLTINYSLSTLTFVRTSGYFAELNGVTSLTRLAMSSKICQLSLFVLKMSVGGACSVMITLWED